MNLYQVKYYDELNKKDQDRECLANGLDEIKEFYSGDGALIIDLQIDLLEENISIPYFTD